jgi:hypothetical protein
LEDISLPGLRVGLELDQIGEIRGYPALVASDTHAIAGRLPTRIKPWPRRHIRKDS